MELVLVDFKNHIHQGVTLKGVTEIGGRNGAGKTAILESIIFAYYGRNLYGGIAVDQFVRNGALSATVHMENDGIVIKRSFSKGEGSVHINGAKARATELMSMLPPLETALSVINPLYFIHEMSVNDRRSMFMKLLPQRSRIEIFKEKYSKDKEMIERFKLSDLDGLKRQKKSLEQTIIANEAMVNNYASGRIRVENSIKELEAITGRAPRGVLQKERDRQKEVNEIEARLEAIGNPHNVEKECKLELKEYADELKPILVKHDKEGLTELKEYFGSVKETLANDVETIRGEIAEYTVAIKQLGQFASGECPVCGSDVSDRVVDEREAKVNLAEARDKFEESVGKYEVIVDAHVEVMKIDKEVEEVRNKMRKARHKKKEYDRLTKKVEVLRSQLVGMTEEDFKKAVQLEANRLALKGLKAQLRNNSRNSVSANKSNVAIRKQLDEMDVLLTAFSPQGVEADLALDTAKRLEKEVAKVLGREVRVVTVRKNKSNERVREVFDVYVDKIRFEFLSFGERILVAVAFGLVARNYLKEFPFKFILLDEASVLSSISIKRLKEMAGEAGVDFYYTKASQSKELTIKYI